MVARHGHIRFLVAVGAAALFAVSAVAEAGSSGKPYSSAQKRQTPYDILRKARKEPQAAKTRENAEIGPIVAKARLRSAPIPRTQSVGYFAKQMRDTTLIKPPELREVPADAPPEPVYFALDIDDRKVHGITYRSTDRMKRAKLRLDTDGDGLLSDEKEYIGTWLSIFRLQTIFEFGPVLIEHTGNGSKASRFYIGCADGQYVILYATHYREGQVKLDGRAHNIALVDCNYNGRYNDVLAPRLGIAGNTGAMRLQSISTATRSSTSIGPATGNLCR